MLNTHKGLIVILLTLILTASCKKDFTTIGNKLVVMPHFEGKLYDSSLVRIYDQKVERVLSFNSGNEYADNLPVQAIGVYKDAVFGKLKANFISGIFPDSEEFIGDYDNNVEILSAQLIVPYYSHTELVDEEAGTDHYVLDSIYGNNPFEIKIYELTYFLAGYDPDTNLETNRRYYSDFDFSPYKGAVIGDTISFEPSADPYYNYELNIDGTYELDDDGNPIVSDSLSPRMVINLDKSYFQEKIFNHWGEDVLTDENLFRDYFRGIYVETIEENDDGRFIMAQFNAAKIQIEYTYESINDNETPDDESDDTIEKIYRVMELNLANPMVNNYINELSSEAESALENSDAINGDAEIYVKGDAASEGIIELFDEQQLRDLRLKDWMINEADLYIYVDSEKSGQLLEKTPRLLIYNYDNKVSLADIVALENYENDFAVYDGYLQEDEDGQEYYKFGITRHVRNVIENDSTNIKLGLRACSSIKLNLQYDNVFLDPDAYNPTGIVLFGNQSGIKPPVLKIYYSEVNE